MSCITTIPLRMCLLGLLIGETPLGPTLLQAQETADEVELVLSQEVQPKPAVTFQLQQYLLRREPALPNPSSAKEWTADAEKIRTRLLAEVIFHGWPEAWVNAPPQVDGFEQIPGGKGFRRWRLRYEVVPGMEVTAILYTPEALHGKAPGILVTMGHFPELGNAVEFNQTLCINYALRRAVVLNPDWIGMGELSQEGNEHWFAAHLDLVGAN